MNYNTLKQKNFTIVELLASVSVLSSIFVFAFFFLSLYRDSVALQGDILFSGILADSAYDYIRYERNSHYQTCLQDQSERGCNNVSDTYWIKNSTYTICEIECHIDEERERVTPLGTNIISGFKRDVLLEKIFCDKELDKTKIIIETTKNTTPISKREYYLVNWFLDNPQLC